MTLVIGLDTAGNRWHAIGPEPHEHNSWESKSDNPDIRRAELTRAFQDFVTVLDDEAKGEGIAHIFCEEPMGMRNAKTTRMLALVAGALWAQCLGTFRITWHWVNISHWKKEVVGNGNANKDDIVEFVRILGFEFPDQDHADAFCLREYGRQELAKLGIGVVP